MHIEPSETGIRDFCCQLISDLNKLCCIHHCQNFLIKKSKSRSFRLKFKTGNLYGVLEIQNTIYSIFYFIIIFNCIKSVEHLVTDMVLTLSLFFTFQIFTCGSERHLVLNQPMLPTSCPLHPSTRAIFSAAKLPHSLCACTEADAVHANK